MKTSLKCGYILLLDKTTFIIVCSLCGSKYEEAADLFSHVLNFHKLKPIREDMSSHQEKSEICPESNSEHSLSSIILSKAVQEADSLENSIKDNEINLVLEENSLSIEYESFTENKPFPYKINNKSKTIEIRKEILNFHGFGALDWKVVQSLQSFYEQEHNESILNVNPRKISKLNSSENIEISQNPDDECIEICIPIIQFAEDRNSQIKRRNSNFGEETKLKIIKVESLAEKY